MIGKFFKSIKIKKNNMKTNTQEQIVSFEKHCETRQQICLVLLDKVIECPPGDAKYYVNRYKKLEEHWKKVDERNNFPHEVFLKMNKNFKETLHGIIDEMILRFFEEQGKKLKKNNNKDCSSECIFCLEVMNKEKIKFVCQECKNSCHVSCITNWMGERINQSCPFCRKIIRETEK